MKELDSITKLTESFKSFPSIGEKSAERMAYALLDMDDSKVTELVKSIQEAKEKIHPCPICGLLTEDKVCTICDDENRDHSTCIILSNEKDVYSFEKLGTFHGVYHVLGGDLSSVKGITPDKLKFKELIQRIDDEKIKEIIIATNPTIEGETTALYLAKLLKDKDIKITRLAYGLPMGGALDYADELTIGKALVGRTNIK
jgi:recombination protein RecR